MPSFKYEIDEQQRIGAEFLEDVREELQRAVSEEKSVRKVTQQQIATKLKTSRAVINRQLMGLENLGLRRVAEILWAIGWEPHFEARKIPVGENQNPAPDLEIGYQEPMPSQELSFASIRKRASAA